MKRWRSILGFAVKSAVSALAAVVVVAVTDVVAKRVNPDLAPSRFDVVRGAQIFKSRCSVCHGDQGGNLGRLGPDLSNIGAVAATRRPELNGAEYILESIMEPGVFRAPAPTATVMMPVLLVADLSDDDIRNLIATVADMGASADEEIAALVIERKEIAALQNVEVRRDVMDLGERVFREKCLDCHAVHNKPEYFVYAPAIFGVGFSKDRPLEDAIMHSGGVETSERYRFSRIAMTDGTELIGKVLETNSDELAVMSIRGEDRGEIKRVKVDEIRTDPDGEPMLAELGLQEMLADLSATPTAKEVEALVALLEALK